MAREIGSLPPDGHNNVVAQTLRDAIAKRLAAIQSKMASISYEPTGGFAIRKAVPPGHKKAGNPP